MDAALARTEHRSGALLVQLLGLYGGVLAFAEVW